MIDNKWSVCIFRDWLSFLISFSNVTHLFVCGNRLRFMYSLCKCNIIILVNHAIIQPNAGAQSSRAIIR